jgi:hypothetical protein
VSGLVPGEDRVVVGDPGPYTPIATQINSGSTQIVTSEWGVTGSVGFNYVEDNSARKTIWESFSVYGGVINFSLLGPHFLNPGETFDADTIVIAQKCNYGFIEADWKNFVNTGVEVNLTKNGESKFQCPLSLMGPEMYGMKRETLLGVRLTSIDSFSVAFNTFNNFTPNGALEVQVALIGKLTRQ